MNIDLLVDEMSKAFDILGEGLQNVAKTLRKLIGCFCEEREEEKSRYKQPYIQVPRHLAYQKRYYQR